MKIKLDKVKIIGYAYILIKRNNKLKGDTKMDKDTIIKRGDLVVALHDKGHRHNGVIQGIDYFDGYEIINVRLERGGAVIEREQLELKRSI